MARYLWGRENHLSTASSLGTQAKSAKAPPVASAIWRITSRFMYANNHRVEAHQFHRTAIIWATPHDPPNGPKNLLQQFLLKSKRSQSFNADRHKTNVCKGRDNHLRAFSVVSSIFTKHANILPFRSITTKDYKQSPISKVRNECSKRSPTVIVISRKLYDALMHESYMKMNIQFFSLLSERPCFLNNHWKKFCPFIPNEHS